MLIGIDSSTCSLSLRNGSTLCSTTKCHQNKSELKNVFVQKSFFFNIFCYFNPNYAYWNQRRLFSGNLPGMFVFCTRSWVLQLFFYIPKLSIWVVFYNSKLSIGVVFDSKRSIGVVFYNTRWSIWVVFYHSKRSIGVFYDLKGSIGGVFFTIWRVVLELCLRLEFEFVMTQRRVLEMCFFTTRRGVLEWFFVSRRAVLEFFSTRRGILELFFRTRRRKLELFFKARRVLEWFFTARREVVLCF